MRLSNPSEQAWRVLIEGDPGAGKTRLVDTANAHSRTSPALHLDARGNTIALSAVKDWPHYILQVETVDDFSQVYNWFAAGQPDKGPIAEYFPGVRFKSVIIDTLTEYQHMALNRIVGDEKKKPGMPMTTPKIQDWGELLRQTVFLVSSFFDLGLHCFITVQSSEVQDQVTGALAHRPQLWGKSEKEVPAYAYVHGYLVQTMRLPKRVLTGMEGEGDRVVLFTPRFDSMAKDQYGLLGPYMFDPTVAKLCEKIYGD